MSWHAIAPWSPRVLVPAARSWALLLANCRCYRGIGNGLSNNGAAPRQRSAGWLTRRESEIPMSSKPARPLNLRAESYLQWPEICLDTKGQAGLYMRAKGKGLMTSFGTGLEISDYTHSARSVAPSQEKERARHKWTLAFNRERIYPASAHPRIHIGGTWGSMAAADKRNIYWCTVLAGGI
jgi:hypothetical protein